MSKEPTIDQMNEVIGVFMGYKMYDKRYPRNHGIGAPEAEPERCLIIQKTKYHTSWDWLMPVIEKCRVVSRDKQREYKSNGVDLNDPKGWKAWSYRYIYLTTDINEMFECVYKFITWYNQQPQTNGQENG